MKCPTSTGVHARPTMYQEGVPRGAIKNFLPRVWSALPALGYMLGLQCIRKECPEGQSFFFLYVKCPLTPVPPHSRTCSAASAAKHLNQNFQMSEPAVPLVQSWAYWVITMLYSLETWDTVSDGISTPTPQTPKTTVPPPPPPKKTKKIW